MLFGTVLLSGEAVASGIVLLLKFHSSDVTLRNIFFTLMSEIKPTGLHFSQKSCYNIAEIG